MQPVNHIFTTSIPNYLSGLPIPDHFTGWFRLGVKDWAKLIPFFTVVGGLSYSVYKTVEPYTRPGAKKGQINPAIKKDVDKVVDVQSIEDIGSQAAYCRCWRSKKFPYCDGAHGAHNKETGDNVGPLVINKK
ncbi:hypothetical protein LSTR_LSTR000216 [Laodelphax striatellus]|uniref:CDGSH iron-sulfur domain-containing protein 2 homologue n=1 Tax=Laodelphax striatellus TaxID=195883 RepID=A0A482X731_LAOST|nr:hypothetical protein LSTR_LSTR000216 [Laodelphax striatellus]